MLNHIPPPVHGVRWSPCASPTRLKMPEARPYRRMALYIILFVIISVIVFIYENYVEESEADGESKFKLPFGKTDAKQKEAASGTKPTAAEKAKLEALGNASSHKASSCYLKEKTILVESCVKCTQFEMDALKAPHCMESGYYEKLKCLESGSMGLKPCFDFDLREASKFNRFTALSLFICASSFMFVKWRREVVEKKAYDRLQQQLEP